MQKNARPKRRLSNYYFRPNIVIGQVIPDAESRQVVPAAVCIGETATSRFRIIELHLEGWATNSNISPTI